MSETASHQTISKSLIEPPAP